MSYENIIALLNLCAKTLNNSHFKIEGVFFFIKLKLLIP